MKVLFNSSCSNRGVWELETFLLGYLLNVKAHHPCLLIFVYVKFWCKLLAICSERVLIGGNWSLWLCLGDVLISLRANVRIQMRILAMNLSHSWMWWCWLFLSLHTLCLVHHLRIRVRHLVLHSLATYWSWWNIYWVSLLIKEDAGISCLLLVLSIVDRLHRNVSWSKLRDLRNFAG